MCDLGFPCGRPECPEGSFLGSRVKVDPSQPETEIRLEDPRTGKTRLTIVNVGPATVPHVPLPPWRRP
jgi:hypothetical protein